MRLYRRSTPLAYWPKPPCAMPFLVATGRRPMVDPVDARGVLRSFSEVEVPVLSGAIRRLNVLLSLVTAVSRTVSVTGIPPMDCATGAIVEGDIATQTAASLRALTACLKAANASLCDVVSVRIYAANAGHYETTNRVYGTIFSAPYPSRTFVPVGSWWRGFDLEIECVAAVVASVCIAHGASGG